VPLPPWVCSEPPHASVKFSLAVPEQPPSESGQSPAGTGEQAGVGTMPQPEQSAKRPDASSSGSCQGSGDPTQLSGKTPLLRHGRTLVKALVCGLEGQPDVALRVDMKTPLANERTVLRWLRSAALLSGLSVMVAHQADGAAQLNGLLLGGIALLFSVWPVCTYVQRSRGFAEAKATMGQPKADRTVPQALALSLASILTAVLMVHVMFGGG